MSDEPDNDTYALKAAETPLIPAPQLNYQPPTPRQYRPRIAVIGAGGIASAHLDAYRKAGWDVVAICNRTLSKAEAKAREFYPDALTTDDPSVIFNDNSVDVVDITPHPAERLALMEAALHAGKHVLSQKPFVLDLDDGERLINLAEAKGVKLAINQNGRWAPHMAWMREAVQNGLIGDLISCHASLHWDHNWVAGTPFEKIDDLILYDFAIHWFDFVNTLVGERARTVFASSTFAQDQLTKVPLMAQVLIGLDGGQASLIFDGATPQGPRDTTYIAGTKGSLHSDGTDPSEQNVTLNTAQGRATPDLQGTWFNDGFAGAMGALLVAIEDDSEPANSARENLASLAMAFAAVESRKTGEQIEIGSIRNLKL